MPPKTSQLIAFTAERSVVSALLLSAPNSPWLLGSYGRALRQLGVEVHHWDFDAALTRHVRLGRIGRIFNGFVPVEPWITKGNRDLIHQVLERSPSLLVFAGATAVRAGALAQIKMSRPETKIVFVWPDTLLNLTDAAITCLPMCDLVASYSSTAVPLLRQLGARNVVWLPFAADTELFPDNVPLTSAEHTKFDCDVSFVGNHRPDRELALLRLGDAGMSVKVWGSATWLKNARDPQRMQGYFGGEVLVGADLVKAVRCSRIALNLIDATNYPAANMRFFELYACGGAPLSSACPEMVGEFADREHAVYFEPDQLVEKAREMMDSYELASSVARRGRELALKAHTYVHRSRAMLDSVGLSTD